MDYLVKMEIELDDEKIIAEGKYDLNNVYKEIRSIYKSEQIPEVTNDEHTLAFSTDESEKYVHMYAALNRVYNSEISSYLKKMLFYSNDRGEGYCEDALYQLKTGDFTSDKAIINKGKKSTNKFDFLYKLEIDLDDEKIIKEGRYDLDNVYDTIRSWFASENISEIITGEHYLTFASNKRGDDKEFARFGAVENAFLDDELLMTYVKRMTWYDTLSGNVSEVDVLETARKYDML